VVVTSDLRRSTAVAGPAQAAIRAAVVTNIYPSPGRPGEGTFVADQVESLRAAGVDTRLVYVPRADGGMGVYRALAGRIRDCTGSVDVVHVMYGGVMADVVTRAVRDVPVLVSFCGTDLLGGKGRGAVHGLARRYGVVASRRAARRAQGVVVKSPNLLAALPRGVDRSRVSIVPNGVDLRRFRPRDRADCRAQLGWNPRRRHVLFPSPTDRPEKRFRLAERAIEAVVRSGIDVELHALVDVAHDDVPTWLNAADIVLLTSAHEGSPNAVKEALACDVPVVSVDVGDVRERIEGVDGCRIADPDPGDIARNLIEVLERGRPIAGRERVAELALPRVAARIRDIYAALAGRTS
jgi:teichuronic acid biosynthesis glycosyltransferase TuaC